MGNHRPLPYEGLHYSKKSPTPGFLFGALIVVAAVVAAIALLFGIYFLADRIDIPIKISAGAASLSLAHVSGTIGV